MPRTVVYHNFHLYNKLHTVISTMMSDIKMTTLYAIKETKHYWMSQPSWAYCATEFRVKKTTVPELSVNIPVINDNKTIKFLEEHAWKEWVNKQLTNDESDMKEAIAYLDRVFPDKEKVYFFELDAIISKYLWGSYKEFNEDGTPIPYEDKKRELAKYMVMKYGRYKFNPESPELILAKQKYVESRTAKKPNGDDKLFEAYMKIQEDYFWQHANIMHELITIGENSVCFPVAFSNGTADWSIEKYGRALGYANAGEIYFVTTPDKVYFEVKRHF